MIGSPAAPAEPDLPPLSDTELAELDELALAADPDEPVGEDAVSLWDLAGWNQAPLLPAWYMPSPMRGRVATGRQRLVIALVVASFLVINAYGLCSTYGSITFG